MKVAKLFTCNRGHKGFTLVETIMAIGVAVILLASISFAIYRVFDANWRGTTHMVAVKEVENAIHYISRDAEMAQLPESTPSISAHAFDANPILLMNWTNEFDSASGNVTYTRDGDKLVRTYTDNTGSVTNTVAEHIDFSQSQWSLSSTIQDGMSYSFRISSSISGARSANETRSFEIVPRSMP
jgi:prepilin-type N-terminal cleavage/methylation domain-containing protein